MYAGRVACYPMVSHVQCAPRALLRLEKRQDRQTDVRKDGRTDERQTITLRFPLYAASLITHHTQHLGSDELNIQLLTIMGVCWQSCSRCEVINQHAFGAASVSENRGVVDRTNIQCTKCRRPRTLDISTIVQQLS